MRRSNKIKRLSLVFVVAALITLIFSATMAIPVSAAENEPPATENCKAFVLYDKTHGEYVIERNGYAILNTSTSAKIMMGLIACEELEDRLDESVTITNEMIAPASGRRAYLKAGSTITIRELLYLAICGTYNDAAYALATIIGGSSQGFVEMMNVRAMELGAKNTTYVNPIGYPDNDGMTTTAYNVLRIALAASDNELYMEICSTKTYTTSATGSKSESNTNQLIITSNNSQIPNPNCYGMNAGWTSEDNGCIVTLIRDTDKKAGEPVDYICVLLGGTVENQDIVPAYSDVNSVASWICRTYNNTVLFPKGSQLGTTKIGLTMVDDAPYIVADDLIIYVPSDASSATYKVELNRDIRAPLKEGDVIGKVVATYEGKKVGECDLILKESYQVNGVMKIIDIIGSYTKSRAFIATIVFFIIAMAVVIIYKSKNRYTSKGKYTRRR